MALRVTETKENIAQEIRNALRDAMDDEEFTDIRFYRYISEDNDESLSARNGDDEYELMFWIDRPASVEDIDRIAQDTAERIVNTNFVDYSIQGYEAIVGAVTATNADGMAYDITEMITGAETLEWEIEYATD